MDSPETAHEKVVQKVTALARPLAWMASALEVFAVLGALGGLCAGIALAFHTKTVSDGGAFLSQTTTSHPWIALGVGVAVGALLGGLVNWCFARALQLFAVDVAARHGAFLETPPWDDNTLV